MKLGSVPRVLALGREGTGREQGMHVAGALARGARRFPAKPAIRFASRRIGYRELNAAVNRQARGAGAVTVLESGGRPPAAAGLHLMVTVRQACWDIREGGHRSRGSRA